MIVIHLTDFYYIAERKKCKVLSKIVIFTAGKWAKKIPGKHYTSRQTCAIIVPVDQAKGFQVFLPVLFIVKRRMRRAHGNNLNVSLGLAIIIRRF